MPTTTKPKVNNDAIKDKVMPLLLQQHNVAALGADRRKAKVEKLEGFVNRAVERGLTLKHVEENIALGRPPHWIEA
jgi:hypothetical protein